jgi:heptosyltransferase-2
MTGQAPETGARVRDGSPAAGLEPGGRILVQAPNWVGDFVMATPAFRCIRRGFPAARISVLLRPYLAKLLDGAPWFDETIPYEPSAGGDAGVRGFVRKMRELRRGRYDLAILLTNSFRTALVARLAAAKVRLGYDLQGRGFLLTHAPRPEREGRKRIPKPMPEYYLDLLEGFGLDRGDDRLELFLPEATRRRGQELLDRWGVGEEDRLVTLNPGASFGSSKLWKPESFARVGDALARE